MPESFQIFGTTDKIPEWMISKIPGNTCWETPEEINEKKQKEFPEKFQKKNLEEFWKSFLKKPQKEII